MLNCKKCQLAVTYKLTRLEICFIGLDVSAYYLVRKTSLCVTCCIYYWKCHVILTLAGSVNWHCHYFTSSGMPICCKVTLQHFTFTRTSNTLKVGFSVCGWLQFSFPTKMLYDYLSTLTQHITGHQDPQTAHLDWNCESLLWQSIHCIISGEKVEHPVNLSRWISERICHLPFQVFQ